MAALVSDTGTNTHEIQYLKEQFKYVKSLNNRMDKMLQSQDQASSANHDLQVKVESLGKRLSDLAAGGRVGDMGGRGMG